MHTRLVVPQKINSGIVLVLFRVMIGFFRAAAVKGGAVKKAPKSVEDLMTRSITRNLFFHDEAANF